MWHSCLQSSNCSKSLFSDLLCPYSLLQSASAAMSFLRFVGQVRHSRAQHLLFPLTGTKLILYCPSGFCSKIFSVMHSPMISLKTVMSSPSPPLSPFSP
jgi:hypothetical protein